MKKKKNEKKAHRIEILKNIFKYIAFTSSIIGVCIEVYNIVSVVLSGREGLVGHISYAAVFLLVLAISLIAILFNRNDLSIFAKTQKMVSHNKEVMHGLRDDFFIAQGIIQTTQDPRRRLEAVINMLLPVVGKMSETLKSVTGADVRVCVKIIHAEKYDDNSTEYSIRTICRNEHRNTNVARAEYDVSDMAICENTDFSVIMNGLQDYFHVDDLYKYSENNVYRNSTHGWEDRYRSAMVFPIRLNIEKTHKTNKYDLMGFVCVDSKFKTTFIGKIGSLCEDYCIGIADTLYVYMKRLFEIQKIEVTI